MVKYDIPEKMMVKMLMDMLLTRTFEERVNELFMQGKIHGTTHLGVGQEAIAAGVSNALRPDDWIQPTHRGHGHCIVKSGNVNIIMAELFGKVNGPCKGMGGSMHIADIAAKNMGTSGIVGGTFPIAVGMGMALKMQKKDAIVTCMFGDAANNQGTFHESLNMASIWNLPILFLCENNFYGMSIPIKYSMAVESVAMRGNSYNIPNKIIDGNNALEVYENVREISQAVRKNGPFLLECQTYRCLGHSKSDQRKYRTKQEEQEWKEKCPIKFMQNFLLEHEYVSQAELQDMAAKAEEIIEEAVKYAENSPYLDLEDAAKLVYA